MNQHTENLIKNDCEKGSCYRKLVEVYCDSHVLETKDTIELIARALDNIDNRRQALQLRKQFPIIAGAVKHYNTSEMLGIVGRA